MLSSFCIQDANENEIWTIPREFWTQGDLAIPAAVAIGFLGYRTGQKICMDPFLSFSENNLLVSYFNVSYQKFLSKNFISHATYINKF